MRNATLSSGTWLLVLALTVAPVSAQESLLTKGLTFYSSFDNTAKADLARGDATPINDGTFSYTKGISDQALHSDGDAHPSVRYSLNQNLAVDGRCVSTAILRIMGTYPGQETGKRCVVFVSVRDGKIHA